MINIFWFRRDLRLKDNIALINALNSEFPVLPIFIFDKEILEQFPNKDDLRVSFIYKQIEELRNQLNDLGSDILVFYETVDQAWAKITNEYDIHTVFFNEDYELSNIKRDQRVTKFLKTLDIKTLSFKDHCIFAKNDILKKDGLPYTVYTAYKNKWLEYFNQGLMEPTPRLNKKDNFLKIKFHQNIEIPYEIHDSPMFKRVIRLKNISTYDKTRDFPYLNSTSLLGLHLRFGTISIRQCVDIAYNTNSVWLSELIWREFFMQIFYHFPKSEKHTFKEKYSKIKWKSNRKLFQFWCEGKTGYPLVDAGMRELNATGHMHNRVRMVCASFLIKHLLIDWKWGEKYFAQKLLDYEKSSNIGNWQWVAGTGCDAAPYFRIFNPETQQKKFDPDFIYINKWVEEFGTNSYPEPIIEHKFAYNRCLLHYKSFLS